MAVLVRESREEEWARLRALRLRALHEDPRAFGRTLAEEGSEDADEWRRRWYGPSFASFVVHDAADTWLGMCGVRLSEDATSAEILGMWVAPKARGAGAGMLLLEAAQACARERGATRIELWVNVAQTGATRLYERGGFAAVGEPWRGTRDPTRVFQRMERDLG